VRDLIDLLDEFADSPPPSATRAVAAAFGQDGANARVLAHIRATAKAALDASPATLRAEPQESGRGWRPRLENCALRVVRERRGAQPRSASQLRAEREEERGEGVAASALCNSASLTRPAAESKRVLVLFSGPYKRDDGMAARLHARGFQTIVVDNDEVHGDPSHDFLSDAFYDGLLRRVEDREFFAIFAGPPCSTFSVSRFYKAKRTRQGDSGPPPVRTRAHPSGLQPPPAGHEQELRRANAIIDRLCRMLEAAHKVGTEFVVEQPADRGDPSSPHTFLFADHSPLWLYPAIQSLQQRTGGSTCTFAQCTLGADYQKYTTLLYSPRLQPWLSRWDDRRCTHHRHAKVAGGSQSSDGKWASRKSAAYPAAMNDGVAEFLLQARQLRLQQLAAEAARMTQQQPRPTDASSPSPQPPTQRRPSPSPLKRRAEQSEPDAPRACVHVVPVSVGKRVLACVPAGGGLFSTPIEGAKGTARKAATAAASEMIPSITGGVAADAVFLAGLLGDEYIAVGACVEQQCALSICSSRAQVLARSVEFGPMSPVWCTLDAIAEGVGSDADAAANSRRAHTYQAAAAAIARTISHACPSAHGAAPGLAIGADAGGPIGRNSTESAARACFEDKRLKAEAASAALRAELLRVADTCDDANLAAASAAWADRFVQPPMEEIPEGLRQQSRDFGSCAHLASMQFVQRCVVPATTALEPPTLQAPCADGWEPSCLEDVLRPKAIQRIRQALLQLQRWHAARLRGEQARRPQPLALGASAFQPRALGRIWDLRACRADGSGRPVLLDTVTPPFPTHLNVDYLEQMFADVADRELVTMLRFGVCVHAELPPQIIIMPNLLSLYDGKSGINEAAAAVSELSGFGWWQQHDFIPFAPWRCAPRGAVPRKDGGAARGIVDQGAPRTPLYTQLTHEPVRSLNEACREGRERREVKPRFADLARNASILLHAADTIGEPLFTIAFDFSKYFHQLWFRPDELWRMGSLLPLADDRGAAAEVLSIHTEMVMSMGLTPSSEIAQRLANALLQVFSQRLRAAEARQGWQQSPQERRWRAGRAHLPHDALGPQDRLHDALMYCDDPAMCVVGVKRAALAIRVWHEMIGGSGLMPAKTQKWQIGAGVQWLGGCCFPALGVMWVPRDKALRVRARIQTVLDGACTPKEYQEIIGFLEHVVDIGRFPRELMAYLHHPMRAGGECERDPMGALEPDGRRDGYLRKWMHILLNVPGASLLAACELPGMVATGTCTWRLRSDAMLETNEAAMGGCLYGAWWRLPLRRPVLTIPVLELLAACVNFIVFADDLSGAQHVVMEIDALASPTVLHKDKARTAGLRAVLAEFRRLPKLQSFVHNNRLHCTHCWGEGNPLGDAASRNKRGVLDALGAALGLRMRQVSVGADALSFINRVLARLDSTPLTSLEIEFDSTLGYPGEGPPALATPARDASCHAPASPSPTLLAFIDASEARLAAADVAEAAPYGAVPSPPAAPVFATASPCLTLAVAAAASSPALHAAVSPQPRLLHPTASPRREASLWATAADHSSAVFTFVAEPWCLSLLPTPSHVDATEEAQRAGAAAQCARAAAEMHAPAMVLRAASAAAPANEAGPSASAPPPAPSGTIAAPPSAATLSIAARERALALTALLRADAEQGGLRMDASEADHLAHRLVQLLEGAAARNTLRGEKSNWKHWMAFCVHRNVEPFRKDVRCMGHAEYDKELVTLSLALLFIYGRMGCRKGRIKPPRPSSALAVLRGIRRAHDRLGVKMADLSLATRLADSLNREYIEAHGWEALQVDRVAPLTNSLIECMLAADAVAGDSVGAAMGRALWATMAQTGFRKAEVAQSSGEAFGPSCLTRHNLRWRIQGVETADPSPEQLRSLRDGDMAILIPPKSKCDQFGLEWSQAPIYLRFHAASAICAARALRDVELCLPRRGLQQREGTALFTTDSGAPVTTHAVDNLFKACLERAGIPAASAARYSPHSFRRYLACALKAQGAADSTIQALLRWKTAESLKLYSFLSDEKYADLVDSAGSADVSSVRTNALPRAEMLDAAHSFHRARGDLAAAARQAEAKLPADDSADDEAASSGSDDDADSAPAAPLARGAPLPQRPRTRKRHSDTSVSSGASPTEPPLSLDNAVGRQAMVPAAVWPLERCNEHGGAGWTIEVCQVDRRVRAALVGFVHARHESGMRYAKEWLEFDSIEPLP